MRSGYAALKDVKDVENNVAILLMLCDACDKRLPGRAGDTGWKQCEATKPNMAA